MTRPFDVTCIGGATQDVFIKSDLSQLMTIRDVFSEKTLLCFEYGSKLLIDKVLFEFGGGGVNASVNFAHQGLKVALMGVVGADQPGNMIIQRLIQRKVHTNFIRQKFDETTGFSVILSSYEGDRTVLTHRGANSHLSEEDLDWAALANSRWIYMSGLSGHSNQILEPFADFLASHPVQFAFNPGSTQVNLGLDALEKVLKRVRVLIMNREEAFTLTQIPPGSSDPVNHIRGCLETLRSYGPELVCITDGSRGVWVYDGRCHYYAPSFPVKVESTLGAGDCFASTFVASLIQSPGNVESAILRASANAAHCVQENGAHVGIVTLAELDDFIAAHSDTPVQKKVGASENLQAIAV